MKQRFPVVVICALLVAALPVRAAAPLTPEQQAVHVLNRLAFGPKPGDIARVTQMGVQQYIDAQLDPESIPYPAALTERLGALDSVNRGAGEVLGEFAAYQKQVRDEDEGAKQKRRLGIARITLETAEARMLRAVDSPRQLEEVMVDFWFNHFNVFSGKGVDRALIASYERDAIRPYVFGSFRALLGATAHHPAMLYYLDNYLSTAPGYVPGGRAKLAAALAPNAPKAKARGLNENYARELMELHTLGVDGGYTQKDVTELARMLTGWTYDQRAMVRSGETFRFDPQRHDAGTKTWLGHEIPDQGQREGEYALDVLAMHPATAHHLSYQLAQYFVDDNPSPALVERMARTYLDTKGDIRSVLRTLFASAEFMAPANVGAKFKTPYQFVVSAARAGATPVSNVAPMLSAMSQLGMPLYGCQTPDGYKNTQDAWLNPDALTRRITFATALAAGRLPLASAPPSPAMLAAARPAQNAGAAPPPAGPMTMAAAPVVAPLLDAAQLQATLGGAISSRTQGMVAGSPEPLRAAMLLGSPDFMQR
ncbi:MAG TPA: DUF1800 domain-containing protein [Telluria sp.]|nr:DUF1800 domain-containing protein [Telluria sp.]